MALVQGLSLRLNMQFAITRLIMIYLQTLLFNYVAVSFERNDRTTCSVYFYTVTSDLTFHSAAVCRQMWKEPVARLVGFLWFIGVGSKMMIMEMSL